MSYFKEFHAQHDGASTHTILKYSYINRNFELSGVFMLQTMIGTQKNVTKPKSEYVLFAEVLLAVILLLNTLLIIISSHVALIYVRCASNFSISLSIITTIR